MGKEVNHMSPIKRREVISKQVTSCVIANFFIAGGFRGFCPRIWIANSESEFVETFDGLYDALKHQIKRTGCRKIFTITRRQGDGIVLVVLDD
jgi:hypothetical protein